MKKHISWLLIVLLLTGCTKGAILQEKKEDAIDVNTQTQEGSSSMKPPIDLPIVSTDDPAVKLPVIDGYTSFLNKLSAALIDGKGNKNLSPISVYLAVAMAAEGAQGETQAEMLKLLGEQSIEDLRTKASAMLRELSAKGETGELILANAIFLGIQDGNVTFHEAYLKTLADSYDASAESVRFGEAEAGQRIAAWIREKTREKIEVSEDAMKFDADTLAVLLNTIYLKDGWRVPFDQDRTEPGTFYGRDGQELNVNYMRRTDSGATIVRGDGYLRYAIALRDVGRMVFVLPDEGVRRRIAEILRLSPDDTFGLLRAIGGDCAGAVAFWEPGKEPSAVRPPKFRELSESEADALLRNLATRPLGIADDFRGISGAGAQDKLIACWKDGKVLLPLEGTPSTHIFKPDIPRFPYSVYNEFFCMTLSRLCGFDTASCEIVRIGGEDYYVTTRYDRELKDGSVVRVHQEDFCQLLKCRPEIKYQDQGGPSLTDCTRLLQRLALPGADILSFIDRVIFNFLIGNGDAHGKNFSVLYHGNRPRLAPSYDLICTTVYPSIARKMAMKFDGQFDFRWVTPGKIVRTFARAGIGEKLIRDSIERQIASIRASLPELLDRANTEHPSEIYHDIAAGIHARIRQLAGA